jgi:hypothetical protein
LPEVSADATTTTDVATATAATPANTTAINLGPWCGDKYPRGCKQACEEKWGDKLTTFVCDRRNDCLCDTCRASASRCDDITTLHFGCVCDQPKD